jgi:hypothetical protein
LIIAMPFNRAASVQQNSASQSEVPKDGGHQRRVGHLEVKEPLRGIEDFAGHPVELLSVVPAAAYVFKGLLAEMVSGVRTARWRSR